MDAPQTAGDWRWRRAGRDSIAEFTAPAGQLLVQMVCTAERNVTFAVMTADTANRQIVLRTETTERMVNASAAAGSLTTVFQPRDSLLDAIAFSRGRFAVQTGAQALYLPAYPEITRVVEDCR